MTSLSFFKKLLMLKFTMKDALIIGIVVLTLGKELYHTRGLFLAYIAMSVFLAGYMYLSAVFKLKDKDGKKIDRLFTRITSTIGVSIFYALSYIIITKVV